MGGCTNHVVVFHLSSRVVNLKEVAEGSMVWSEGPGMPVEGTELTALNSEVEGCRVIVVVW